MPLAVRERIFNFGMSEARCTVCGADLIAGTGFCRECGAPIVGGAEDPTAILNHPPDGTTQRLDPRPTNPYREAASSAPAQLADASATAPPGARPRKFLFVGVLIVAVLAGSAIVGVVRSVLKNHTVTRTAGPVSRALIYPGSRIVLDLSQDSGSGVLQLMTSDPLDQVKAWYVTNLKPDKILQATMSTAILRKDNVTATLVSENNSTTIVIKQSAR